MGAASSPIGFADARVGVATAGAAALVAQQVVGKALRDTLFLGTFGVERLPYAMLAAALLSGALILALSRAAARRSARRLARGTLALGAALFLVAWAISGPAPRAGAAVAYLQVGALSAASISVFWSLVSESFDPYAARAAIPRIMAGATLGGVLGGLLTWRAARWMPAADLLPLGAALDLAALVAVSWLPGGERIRAPSTAAPERAPERGWRALVLEAGPLRAVALLVVVAAVTQAILDYLLSSEAVAAIGTGPGLLSFFALFQTAVGVLSFLLQVAVSRSALERFGVGPVLAAPPAVVLGGVLGASLAPPLAAAVFLRGADGVLGASLHRSGYEVLFAPIDARERRASKPLIDVGFDRLGTLAGSALVALVLAATSTRARVVLLALVAALAAWRLALSFRLAAGYRRTLADHLRDGRLAASAVLDRATVGALSHAASALDRGALLADVARLRGEQARAEPPDDAARLSLAAFDVPVCPEPEAPPAGEPGEDEVIAALRELRSGDAGRARRILVLRRTDPLLAPQVIALLADDRVARDAADWLTAQVPPPTGVLADALLSDQLSDTARRRVARLLGKSDDPRAAEALLAALPWVPTGVRPGLAHALARASARRPLPQEPLLAAATRAAEEARSAGGRPHLDAVFALLAAAYPREPVRPALRALERGGAARGTALEWLDVLLPTEVKRALWPHIVRSGERIPATVRDADALRRAMGAEPLTPAPAGGGGSDRDTDS